MRIALFGGSFNPIHCGHLAIAEAVVQQGLADEVWLMVSPHNPLKSETDLANEQLRYQWTQKAVEDIPHVEASDYEFRMPRPSYTYLTLRQLRKERPEDTFCLCIGADNWNCFSKWREYEEILTHHPIIVYPRENHHVEVVQQPNVTLLNMPLHRVSSTDIRQRLERGESIEGLVPSSLIQIIQQAWKR